MTEAARETTFLGLGSNLGDREANLVRAAELLSQRALSGMMLSGLYETDPVDFLEQPQFLNAVVRGATALPPGELLRVCKEIEREVGRTPTFRYGPRHIDIDILFYGELAVDLPSLTLPHPRAAERAFVLVPLAEVEPEWVHPALGITAKGLAERVGGREGVRLWKRVWGSASPSAGEA